MALDTAPLLWRKRNTAFALEATNGTPATIAATDGVTPIFNTAMTYETETIERVGQGSLSPIRQGRGARPGTATFETELFGSETTTDPIWFTRLLAMCGMSITSHVATPVDGATQTGSIALERHGRRKLLAGCMGTFTLTARRGHPARFAWNFRGVQAPPADVTQILPTYLTTIAPRVGAATFTIGGATYRVPQVEIELGNEVILREDITAVDSAGEATGYRCAYITNRRVMVRCAPEALPLSTRDWQDVYRDSTTLALALDIGTVAGNQFNIDCPKLELARDPSDEDREGMYAESLEFLAIHNAAAGADELSIEFVPTA